jgi:hypothetical protein
MKELCRGSSVSQAAGQCRFGAGDEYFDAAVELGVVVGGGVRSGRRIRLYPRFPAESFGGGGGI